MSWKATQWAKETRGHRSPGQKLVLMVLSDYHNTEVDRAWVKQKTLAEDCEIPERTVKWHLANLATDGFIAVEHEGRRAVYRLNRSQSTGANIAPIRKGAKQVSDTGSMLHLSGGYTSNELELREPELLSTLTTEWPEWIESLRQAKGWLSNLDADRRLVVWAERKGILVEHLEQTALEFAAKHGKTKKLTYENPRLGFMGWARRPPLVRANRNGQNPDVLSAAGYIERYGQREVKA